MRHRTDASRFIASGRQCAYDVFVLGSSNVGRPLWTDAKRLAMGGGFNWSQMSWFGQHRSSCVVELPRLLIHRACLTIAFLFNHEHALRR